MQCTRAQSLELYANADSCNEILHSNSCPIFTLAAEQVVIHCITTAHQNAKLVSISSSRADRSYTFSLYFAHREQVQHCTLAHRERVQTLLQRSTTTLYFAHREQVQALLGAANIPQQAAKRHTACLLTSQVVNCLSQQRDGRFPIPTRKRKEQQSDDWRSPRHVRSKHSTVAVCWTSERTSNLFLFRVPRFCSRTTSLPIGSSSESIHGRPS